MPGVGFFEVVAEAKHVFAIGNGLVACGDGGDVALLWGDFREGEFAFADRHSVFEEFPRGVEVVEGSEEILVGDFDFEVGMR